MCIALYLVAEKKGVELPEIYPFSAFSDHEDFMFGVAAEAIYGLQQAGVITGFPDGSFGPELTLTRAQAAALMVRYTNIEGL